MYWALADMGFYVDFEAHRMIDDRTWVASESWI